MIHLWGSQKLRKGLWPLVVPASNGDIMISDIRAIRAFPGVWGVWS